jgi:hypothetical protein
MKALQKVVGNWHLGTVHYEVILSMALTDMLILSATKEGRVSL